MSGPVEPELESSLTEAGRLKCALVNRGDLIQEWAVLTTAIGNVLDWSGLSGPDRSYQTFQCDQDWS